MLTQITSFRFTPTDKAELKELARRLQLSHADTIRFLVRETLEGLKKSETQAMTNTKRAGTQKGTKQGATSWPTS